LSRKATDHSKEKREQYSFTHVEVARESLIIGQAAFEKQLGDSRVSKNLSLAYFELEKAVCLVVQNNASTDQRAKHSRQVSNKYNGIIDLFVQNLLLQLTNLLL
jgi:uncharacterized FlgJ-related protein